MKYGLTDNQLKQILDVLAQYPNVEKAVIFGSRAIGNNREASDVDIAIMGKKADFNLAGKIKSHLEDDTYLPYFFDIISYNDITSKEIKQHIQKYGKVIYEKPK